MTQVNNYFFYNHKFVSKPTMYLLYSRESTYLWRVCMEFTWLTGSDKRRECSLGSPLWNTQFTFYIELLLAYLLYNENRTKLLLTTKFTDRHSLVQTDLNLDCWLGHISLLLNKLTSVSFCISKKLIVYHVYRTVMIIIVQINSKD